MTENDDGYTSDTIACDRCESTIYYGEPYFEVIAGHGDIWGSDERISKNLCSLKCVKKEQKDYFDNNEGINHFFNTIRRIKL